MPENSFGYGRIIRDNDQSVSAIVEQKDASESQQKVIESNSGIIFISGKHVNQLVGQIDNTNAQSEFYLTDIVKHASSQKLRVNATICADANEVNGVNNQQQLAVVEAIYRQRLADKLMMEGAKLYDPQRIDVRGNLTIGKDVEIDINCIFEGDVPSR